MTLKEIIQKIKNKELSAEELTSHYAGKIKANDEEINGFISFAEEKALKKAKEADTKRGDNEGGFSGIPYAVKDSILVKDMPATAGSKILENYNAPYNATAVSKLNREGGIPLGKTNMDEFAMGSSTENSAFGTTRNPIDTSRVSGGSSGGSAAAVYADMTPFALGSDTGGSIRQPAAFCGVCGFKPTYGAVSRYGLIAMASSLDQIGVITKTAEDAGIVLERIAGRDRADATSMDLNSEQDDKVEPKNLKIGLIKEFMEDIPNEGVKRRIEEAVNYYKNAGAEIKEVSLPHVSYSLAAYHIIMPAEASSNLARYEGIRYGATQGIENSYASRRGEGFGAEVKRRIMLGTYTLSAGHYDAYYIKAQKVRTLIKNDFENAFNEVDVIATPTTPGPAFKVGEKTKDPLEMYLSDVYTVSANLAGLPAVSIPAGTVKEEDSELPVGLQIMGPQKSDFRVLNIAQLYENNA